MGCLLCISRVGCSPAGYPLNSADASVQGEHGDIEAVPTQLHRDHAVFSGNILREQLRQLSRDLHPRQIHILNTQLLLQRAQQLLLRNDFLLNQFTAQAIFCYLLRFQRMVL